MNSLNGKVAIVTGASKGIGAAIAKGLAEAGAAVAVNYASDREGAERAVADILAKGGKAVAIRADMSKSAEVKQLFEETKKALGSPNVLVNNAGIFEFGPVQDISEAQFHRHFDINVLGTMLAIQEALRHFPAEGGQHRQYQLDRERKPGTEFEPLCGDQGRGGRDDAGPRQGARAAEDPR